MAATRSIYPQLMKSGFSKDYPLSLKEAREYKHLAPPLLNKIGLFSSHNASRSNIIETNWIIITGAPNAGKTTILNLLHSRFGFEICIESFREYIKQEIKAGRKNLDEHLSSQEAHDISFRTRLHTEQNLDPHRLIILDRGLPDTFSYHNKNNRELDQSQRLAANAHLSTYRYKAVFHFDSLPSFEDDGIRKENSEERTTLQKGFHNAYLTHGYIPIRVKIMSPVKEISIEQRLLFVKNEIERLQNSKRISVSIDANDKPISRQLTRCLSL